MSESKNHRPVSEVQQAYSQVCARLGHVEYQLYLNKRDAESLKKELEELNLEAAASAAASQAAVSQPSPEAAPVAGEA